MKSPRATHVPIVALTLVIATAANAAADAPAAGGPIAKGDVLLVSISDLAGPGVRTELTVTVDADGAIPLPLIGKVAVAGLTGPAAEGKIAKTYRDHNLIQRADVSVRRAPPPKKHP